MIYKIILKIDILIQVSKSLYLLATFCSITTAQNGNEKQHQKFTISIHFNSRRLVTLKKEYGCDIK